MEDRIVQFNGQIEESRLDQLKTSLNNLGVQFTVQTFEDLGLAEVETANTIPSPQQQQQTQQKVQIVHSSDGKIQVRGLLPRQQLVQMPDGKLQIFSQPTAVCTTTGATTTPAGATGATVPGAATATT